MGEVRAVAGGLVGLAADESVLCCDVRGGRLRVVAIRALACDIKQLRSSTDALPVAVGGTALKAGPNREVSICAADEHVGGRHSEELPFWAAAHSGITSSVRALPRTVIALLVADTAELSAAATVIRAGQLIDALVASAVNESGLQAAEVRGPTGRVRAACSRPACAHGAARAGPARRRRRLCRPSRLWLASGRFCGSVSPFGVRPARGFLRSSCRPELHGWRRRARDKQSEQNERPHELLGCVCAPGRARGGAEARRPSGQPCRHGCDSARRRVPGR